MTQRTAARRRRVPRRRPSRPHEPSTGLAPDGWEIMASVESGPVMGPNVRASSIEEVTAALSRLPADLGWEDVASRILPLFERARPAPAGFPDHVVATVPPGVRIGLGIDMGPAFAYVTTSMIDGWSLSTADVTARALANLHACAMEVEPTQIVWGTIDHVETGWLQTEHGIASTLILAPQELERIFGSRRWLFVAPMRDLLIGLPPDEEELATWLFAEIASEDPNHLHPRLFRFDGRNVRVQAMGA